MPVLIAESKTQANGGKAHDSDRLKFRTTPSNYEGGYFVVTGLNGTGLTASKVKKTTDGEYYADFYADDTSVAGKKNFAINWYDKNGNILGKPLKVTATILAKSELIIAEKDKKVEMDFKSSYNMKASIPYKSTNDWNKSNISLVNSLFELDSVDAKKFTIVPTYDALYAGTIVPGKTYAVDVFFSNRYGAGRTETIQVTVKPITEKDIIVKAYDVSIYKNAPYEQRMITISTTKPNAGMIINNVEITDTNSPFEIRTVQTRDGAKGVIWAIAYKANQYNSTLIGKQNVNLKITYQNGLTKNTSLMIVVK